MWYMPRLYKENQSDQLVVSPKTKNKGAGVSKQQLLYYAMPVSCELVVALVVGHEYRISEISIVRGCYQEMTSEDSEHSKSLIVHYSDLQTS